MTEQRMKAPSPEEVARALPTMTTAEKMQFDAIVGMVNSLYTSIRQQMMSKADKQA